MVVLPVAVDVEAQHHAQPDLKKKLLVHLEAVARSVAPPGRELEPIVYRAQRPQPDETDNPHADVETGQVGEQQRGEEDGG